MDDSFELIEKKSKKSKNSNTFSYKNEELDYKNPEPAVIRITEQADNDFVVVDKVRTYDQLLEAVDQNMPGKSPTALKISKGSGSIKQILGLYNELNATDKKTDSFAMSMVKDSLIALSESYGDDTNKDKTYRAKRAREVSALLLACENYRANRFPDGVPKNERHNIVSKLIIAAGSLLEGEDKQIMDMTASVNYYEPREALYKLSGTRGMSDILQRLGEIDNLTVERMPRDEESFDRQREIILQKYDELILRLREYTGDTSRITESTKNKYRIFANALVSLSAERERILRADYKKDGKKSAKKSGKRWKSFFAPEGSYGADKKAPTLFSAIGGDFYLKEGDTVHKSLEEIREAAKNTGTEICYSNQTIFDLTSIQIIDAIAGIKNRSQDTLAFRYRRKKAGGRYILELYDVKVKNTDINGFGGHGRFGVIPDSYDNAFADRLLKLSPSTLIKAMEKEGYTADAKEREALIKRFT
ncbi:MAG: hypothetical protein J6N76_03785, partial [Lachnospiraceae bacterium]|nr:hypothetical protein [Lachnospiraceae bacterium]